MNALTVGLLVFLTLIKTTDSESNPFEVDKGPLIATEGSCVDIECKVKLNDNRRYSHWFWIKDAVYNKMSQEFDGTIIYSSDSRQRPVSTDYAGRARYTGSNPTRWYTGSTCSISICNLTKSDSGNYSFRILGTLSHIKWITTLANLTVKENPCPLTFEQPPAVKESETITLNCSTLDSCTSQIQIGGLPEEPSKIGKKSVSISFQANWKHDGKEVSCQTQANHDGYLIQKVRLNVEYAPKETVATITPMGGNVEENKAVTLTCSAKGRPAPKFTWMKNNDQTKWEGKELTFYRITESQSGEYYCEARNDLDVLKSGPVELNVVYAPEVEVQTSSAGEVAERDSMNLTCNVKRSKPPPQSFAWFRSSNPLGQNKKTYFVGSVTPEDSGDYRCEATNSVGRRRSQPRNIQVKFTPRNTQISSQGNNDVKVGNSLTFICSTEAHPTPTSYSWSRYSETKQIANLPSFQQAQTLVLYNVKREDEACYTCNATNEMGTGADSEPVCIKVRYPPTEPILIMDSLVSEGQSIIISCTVESYPEADLHLTRTNSQKLLFSNTFEVQPNTFRHILNVTSGDSGFYTCNAKNNEGKSESVKKELRVEYSPKDVMVKAQPGLDVNENSPLTMRCDFSSYPPATSFSWMKKTKGKSEKMGHDTWRFTMNSVRPSDSGLYSCAAGNKMGTGKSQEVEVKVRYGPKNTTISRGPEQQDADGTRRVTLTCSSDSDPPVNKFSWHRKNDDDGWDKMVERGQKLTVSSDEPGFYYCIAGNDINTQSSEPVQVFVGVPLKALIIFSLILLLIIVLFFVYRHKRNKSIRQGATGTPCCVSLGLRNGARSGNLINEPHMAEPSRSRDDLLPDQPCRPAAQRRQQHCPDRTPASNIETVYSTVNLPAGKQGPSGGKANKQQAGNTPAPSLTYASLHFGKKEKKKEAKAEPDLVYAMVSKPKQPNQKTPENQGDYENVGAPQAAIFPNHLDSDSDTSEEEVEINYSEVRFTEKHGHHRAKKDSSSSEDEETQYSAVKLS